MVAISEWTGALRSKKYWQGTRALYDSDSNTYCCLGVLCELAGCKLSGRKLDSVDIFEFGDSFGKGIDKFFARDNMSRLEYLAFLNDMGLSFNVIAKEIEAIEGGDDGRYLQFTRDASASLIQEVRNFHTKGV